VPAYGNLLLESIARTMTGKTNLSLKFKYTLWDQSLSSIMSSNFNFSYSIVTIGNISNFYLEAFLAFLVLKMKTSSFFGTSLMKGGTRATFVLSLMVWYFVISFLFMELFWLSNFIYSVDTAGWQVFGLVWVISYTLYLGFFASVIVKHPGFIGL